MKTLCLTMPRYILDVSGAGVRLSMSLVAVAFGLLDRKTRSKNDECFRFWEGGKERKHSTSVRPTEAIGRTPKAETRKRREPDRTEPTSNIKST